MSTEMPTASTPLSCAPQQQPKLSQWEPEFAGGAIIEWRCGACGHIVYYGCWRGDYCPACGAPIFSFPRKKLDGPQYRLWPYRDQEGLIYDGPDDRPRSVGDGAADRLPRITITPTGLRLQGTVAEFDRLCLILGGWLRQ